MNLLAGDEVRHESVLKAATEEVDVLSGTTIFCRIDCSIIVQSGRGTLS